MQEDGFLSGVIEGFYGHPWTQDQRKDLFQQSQGFGFNAYVYAPKDDKKHREGWREPYTEIEEGENHFDCCFRMLKR